jgi:hypothetical protein
MKTYNRTAETPAITASGIPSPIPTLAEVSSPPTVDEEAVVEGGSEEVDGGVVEVDGGVVEVDGGVVEVDGGVVEVDGGVVEVGLPVDVEAVKLAEVAM